MTKGENERLVRVEDDVKGIREDLAVHVFGRNGSTPTSINGRVLKIEKTLNDLLEEVRAWQSGFANRLGEWEREAAIVKKREEWEQTHEERSTKKTGNLREWLLFPLIILQTVAFFLAVFIHP